MALNFLSDSEQIMGGAGFGGGIVTDLTELIQGDARAIINSSIALINQLIVQLGLIGDFSIDVSGMESFTNPTESLYSSALESQVAAKVSDEIANGSYGLEPQDEADLWNRERDREQVNAQSTMEEVKRQFAQTGFPVPPGVMNKAIERTVETAVQKISSVNRDISLKRADLYWQGKQFAWTKVIEIENIMSRLYDSMKGRYLDGAKFEVQTSIEKAKVILQAAIETAKLTIQKGIANLESHTRLAASALAMMNVNVSMGAHAGASESANYNASSSTSVIEHIQA